MLSRLFHCLILFCAGVALSCCAPGADVAVENPVREVEMDGQVFIVSAEGDSIPLSLVTVQVFERDEISRFLEVREVEIERQKEEMKRVIEQRERELAEARSVRDELAEEHRARRAAIAEERSTYLGETVRRIEEYVAQIERNEVLIGELNEVPRIPEGVPSRSEIEAYRERRDRWFSMRPPEREAWREILAEQNQELVQLGEEISREREERIASWIEEEEALVAALDEHDELIARAEASLRDLVEQSARFPSINEFFAGLPDPALRVRTDANGEFVISLPEDRRVALVARVNREVRNNTEIHAWLIWLDPARQQRQKMLLSNHNSLILENGAEELLQGAQL